MNDYIMSSVDLAFPASSSNGDKQCMDIVIVDDSAALEGDETFSVILTTSEPNVLLVITRTEVTITDNDGER